MTPKRSKVRAKIRAFDYFRASLGPSLTKNAPWQLANTSEESIYAECFSNSDINSSSDLISLFTADILPAVTYHFKVLNRLDCYCNENFLR